MALYNYRTEGLATEAIDGAGGKDATEEIDETEEKYATEDDTYPLTPRALMDFHMSPADMLTHLPQPLV